MPVADAAPALAEGAGGIEPAGEAERAAAARPEALASWTQGEAGREAEAPPGEGEQELKAPPLKGRGKPKALPPEGERELDAMPQGNPNEGEREVERLSREGKRVHEPLPEAPP